MEYICIFFETFQQFQSDSQQLDEGLGTVAKVAIKSAVKFAKKGGLKKVGKKVGKLFKKKPRRTIDPFFADKAVERGTMVRGYHGQSAKNIAQYTIIQFIKNTLFTLLLSTCIA